MNHCHPPDHSHFLVHDAIKGACAESKRGDAGRQHHFYSFWLILCSHEGWLRRRLTVFCIRMCLEIQKRGVAFWGGKSHLRTMCKGKAAGPEVHSACMGLQEDTCLSQRKGLPAIPFSLWGTTFYSPLCGQWKEHRLWFLGMLSTREKALTTSACV